MRRVIRCAGVIAGHELQPVPDGALVVDGGAIAAVGPFERLQADMGSNLPKEELDLRPHWILPGLIDAHVHLFGSPEPRSLWMTQYESDARLALRAGANARTALAVGVTTICDCGARGDVVRSLARAVEEGMVPGPRIVHSGSPITSTAGHCYFFGIEAEGIPAVQKAVRDLHKAGIDFIKVMVTGGGLTAGSNRSRSQYSLAELRALADDAHRLGYWIAGHAHGTEGIRRAVQAGFDAIEHCSWLAPDSELRQDYDPDLVDDMVERGTYVCRTRSGVERAPIEEASSEHRLWDEYEVSRRMARAGVKLVAGTDAGVHDTPFDGLVTTLESMVGFGEMSALDVLVSATAMAAQSLGLGEVIGTLTPGKRADLIAVDGSPLEDLRALREVRAVLIDGEVVAREGQVLD